MTVFNPDNVRHTFKIIPRYYNFINTLSPLIIELLNEDKNNLTTISELEILDKENGYITFSFDATLNEGESFQIKITNTETNLLHFRGKAFATNKATQNYSING